MSGIFGFSSVNIKNPTGTLAALSHWNRCYGREGHDTLLTNEIGIGCYLEHLSSAISAPKPIIRRNDHIAVIDALLYNRNELLQALGLDSASDISDEELLFLHVDTHGYDALKDVNGDFSGAIYSKQNRSWTLFRDHSGVRPLFFYKSAELFAFSTDLRGLAAMPDARLKINEEQFYLRMMGFNSLSLCDTEYENICCIRPASWTVIRHGNNGFEYQEHIYWKWHQHRIRMKRDEDYQTALRELITDSIRRRLDAYPGIVGCELSGGLDSSVIAILINRLGRKGCYYSWSYSVDDLPINEKRDERQIIFDICAQEGIECHFHQMKKEQPEPKIYRTIRPPYSSTPSICIGSEFMRSRDARVVFTGHGGDEGVSHRCNLYELWYHHEYVSFMKILYRDTAGLNLRPLRTIKNALHQIFVVNKDFRKPFYKGSTNASRFVDASFAERMKPHIAPRSLTFAYDPAAYILQGGHRPRLDNIAYQGAECGVRYLVPFLDYRVLDFALSIPRAQYRSGNTNRYIYRQAFYDMIPQSLRDMRYKDTPSMEGYKYDENAVEIFHKKKAEYLETLDRDFWKGYLNFDALDAFDLPADYTFEQYNTTAFLLHDLSICIAIQNVADHAPEWSKDHETTV